MAALTTPQLALVTTLTTLGKNADDLALLSLLCQHVQSLIATQKGAGSPDLADACDCLDAQLALVKSTEVLAAVSGVAAELATVTSET